MILLQNPHFLLPKSSPIGKKKHHACVDTTAIKKFFKFLDLIFIFRLWRVGMLALAFAMVRKIENNIVNESDYEEKK